MLNEQLTYLPPNKPVRLRNETCIYCSVEFGNGINRTKEHVIGRNFVPQGALNKQWNLIANACLKCNGIKSTLEDDISAITMQPDVVGRHAADDPRLRNEAQRKAKGSISRRTKKPVAQSGEEMTLSGALAPGVSITFNLHATPQLDEERAFHLALYQIRGFFYWITYDHARRRGRFWTDSFAPIGFVQKQDWGNVQMRGFQELVASWEHRVRAIGADEFFKIIIRRSPDERPLWAWALEWNCNHRLIGFFGNDEAARNAADALPCLQNSIVQTGPKSYLSGRIEVPLLSSEDRLFCADDEAGTEPVDASKR